MDATLYLTDGTQKEITPTNGTDFQLDELCKLLNCDMVEVINIGDPMMIMIGDEDGRCKENFIINQEAMRIYREGIGTACIIVGNIICCPSVMLK